MPDEYSLKIEEAISNALKQIDGYTEGDILIDWVVVSYVENANDSEISAHPMLVSNGNMPTYRLRGLLHEGLHRLDCH